MKFSDTRCDHLTALISRGWWSRIEVAGCSFANCCKSVTAKWGIEKRKTLACVVTELVIFSPESSFGRQDWYMCWSQTTLSPPASQELTRWILSNSFLHFQPTRSPNDIPCTLDNCPLISAGFYVERPPSHAAPILTMSNPLSNQSLAVSILRCM